MGPTAQGAAPALKCLALLLLRDGRRCAELTGGEYFMSIFLNYFLGSGVFVKLTDVIKHLVSNFRFDLQ